MQKVERVQWTWFFVVVDTSECEMVERRNEGHLIWNLHDLNCDIVERYLVEYSNEILF